MLLNTTAESSKINDGAYIIYEPLEIHPCALVFPPMGDEEYREFKEDISGQGLIDPIIIFQGKILDGRHRYNACRDLQIDVWGRKWEGGMSPMDYVLSKNLHRRNLTPAQRATAAAKALDYFTESAKERQREAGKETHSNQYKKVQLTAPVQEPASVPELVERKPEATNQAGKAFGVSGRAVAAAKYVLDHGTDEQKKALESPKAKITPIEKEVREQVKIKESIIQKSKAKFNETNDSIEWATFSWNPVTGCNHVCKYCYARDIANHYPQAFPNGFKPTFHEDRLDAPKNTNIPTGNVPGSRNVFVCSMADLFGEWVPQEWIDKVLDSCRNAPQWTFIFLTKNPKRLTEINWPNNAWIGTTVDCQKRVDEAVSAFKQLKNKNVKFVSCEPLQEEVSFSGGLQYFDWVIIGGQSKSTGCPASQPKWEWVESLHAQARDSECSIYWKPNLTVRPKEYPLCAR